MPENPNRNDINRILFVFVIPKVISTKYTIFLSIELFLEKYTRYEFITENSIMNEQIDNIDFDASAVLDTKMSDMLKKLLLLLFLICYYALFHYYII